MLCLSALTENDFEFKWLRLDARKVKVTTEIVARAIDRSVRERDYFGLRLLYSEHNNGSDEKSLDRTMIALATRTTQTHTQNFK